MTTGTFSGTIGNATNATNVYVTPTNTAGTYYPTFVSGNTTGNKSELLDTDLTYDPSKLIKSITFQQNIIPKNNIRRIYKI